MEELLVAVAKGLVDDKDAVRVTVDEPNEEGMVVYHLSVAEGDMGRVIGKQGRIAKAIRVVMRAAGVRQGVKVMVEID
ncbi:MAG TPA: KH domain-containing protein [Candidatus Anaerofilum excrementigallinarum]|nr:KH domain-containing protein [Candidatus Anaerofilum excrementigallinarum]